jgi:hypothetical protein
VIQLSAGGGSATPDWPVGDVTPKAGIAIGSANLDAAIAIAVNVGSDGLPEFAYLATTGTLNVNEASPELAGSVTGLSFRQYDNLFGGSAPPAPDADGCMTTMPSIGFDATVSESGSGSSGVSAAPRAVARR